MINSLRASVPLKLNLLVTRNDNVEKSFTRKNLECTALDAITSGHPTDCLSGNIQRWNLAQHTTKIFVVGADEQFDPVSIFAHGDTLYFQPVSHGQDRR